MKRVLAVFGTRPEAVKMGPLVRELREQDDFRVEVLSTGQHRELLAGIGEVFGMEVDYTLEVLREGQSLAGLTGRILEGVDGILERAKPDVMLVHGDTTTAFAAGLAGFYRRIPVGHVEAGLRTGRLDSPFPEEYNRRAIGGFAAYHFAPTARARDTLLREGKEPRRVYLTGNTGIDALRYTVHTEYEHPALPAAGERLVLLTLHRRENLGEPMRQALRAIRRVAESSEGVRVVYPLHCNPEVRAIAEAELRGCRHVTLTEPLGVVDFHNFLARCYLVLTDSGGIQEEASALGKPVLVLRDTTERPEGVRAGTLRLVGTREAEVEKCFRRLLLDERAYGSMVQAGCPFGDGRASERIAEILRRELAMLGA